MKMNIPEQLEFKDDKPATLQLKNTDKQHTIVIGLKKGQILKKHFSATPALLIVLKGLIAFEMEGTTTQVAALNTFDIPPTIPHEVTGVEESIFLLIKDKA
ncbi:hypothetical protein AAE02nite_26970 [Adhaeribacter aerolatus]|uniref:Cupin 2 conserved barrel domain-containing protein n=1 Tax=Adhaeribacter aerolatus TaxID=670289 RepID=A0A512AZ82_9BACT|nr:hypothetical protein [Adhaeribacter aerolatus]GEO05033.1 hypothetical protein AAE02nite_26970 [Adhaeribacter aerolatus]